MQEVGGFLNVRTDVMFLHVTTDGNTSPLKVYFTSVHLPNL